jgi:hypothetical protein
MVTANLETPVSSQHFSARGETPTASPRMQQNEQGHGDAPEQPPTPYTTWTTRDRVFLVCLLGYLALASSLTANIYFPLIDLLAERYDVSTRAIT